MKFRAFLTALVLPLALAACGGTTGEPAPGTPSTTDRCFNPDAGVFQCFYILTSVEGQALPYESLPRESYEDPEALTGGRLSIDSGSGKGTYSLRYDWTETRSGTNSLDHSMQDAGNFETAGDGTVTFTSVSGPSFTGKMSVTSATIADFPLSTNNVTLPLELDFDAE